MGRERRVYPEDSPQELGVTTGIKWGFPSGANGRESACPCKRHKRQGFNPWVGKILWRRKWQPTSVFLLENSMDRGAWWAIVHEVAKSQT